MKVAVLLLLALVSLSVLADEREEIKKYIHEMTELYKNEWIGFQAGAHLQESWDLPKKCMDDAFEESGVEMIMAIVQIIETQDPVTQVIKFLTEGYKMYMNVKRTCELDKDYEELRLYCKISDCSVTTVTARAYKHIEKIRELAEEISNEPEDTPESQFIIGYDYAHIATLVLGVVDELPARMLKKSA